MKKTISLILAVVLIFSVSLIDADALPVSEREKVLAMACYLFPERADIIRNQNHAVAPFSATPSPAVKVYEETRRYSDNLDITYTEYSDGTAYITKANYELTQVSSEIISKYLVSYTCDLAVYTNYDKYVLGVNGISFLVDSLWYDSITNRGTITSDSLGYPHYGDDYKLDGDPGGDAYVTYIADFPRQNAVAVTRTVKFSVGRGTVTISIDPPEE